MKVLLGERWKEKELGVEGVLVGLTEDHYRGWLGHLSTPCKDDVNQQKEYLFPMDRLGRIAGQPKARLTRKAGVRHKLKFGKVYTDIVNGAQGKAMARTEHLTGCERITLQYLRPRDGEVLQFTVDDSVLEELPPPPKNKPRPPGPPTERSSLAQSAATPVSEL